MTTYRKKPIEVALLLDVINKAVAREKSIRHLQSYRLRFAEVGREEPA